FVLAYLLDPIANRLERLGLSRLAATLLILLLFVAGATIVLWLVAPTILRELSYFIDSAPRYLQQLRSLASDPQRPWVSKIVGEGLGVAERSFGELTSFAASWFSDFLRSAWSGGKALLSVFSLAIVAPIAAGYLIYDWK